MDKIESLKEDVKRAAEAWVEAQELYAEDSTDDRYSDVRDAEYAFDDALDALVAALTPTREGGKVPPP